ncbi:hypothetical protein H6775_03135 [Candidatus Nomurabacteria bacterium]|nr:hypothetical protein [Candidatus Nomurabacteria bacterium]
MEPQFKTSFIPKKPIQPSLDKKVAQNEKGVNFFMLVAVIIFVTAVLLSVAVFAYKLTLKGRIELQLRTLEKAREAFDPGFISEATRLNTRIVSANKILNNHLSPSAIFDLLEKFTLQTVSFKSFVFADGGDGALKVTATGEADSFKSVVLQSDKFDQSGYMRDLIFDGLEPNDDGNVNFKLSVSIDPQLVLFRKNLVPIDNTPTAEDNSQNTQPANDLGVFGNSQQ